MATIEGHDVSKYQLIKAENVAKMREKGIRFACVRCGQGPSYKDPKAEEYTKLFQDGGILTSGYLFVTNDNPTLQYNNFTSVLNKFQWDLPPWMDCEAYAGIRGQVYSMRELYMIVKDQQLLLQHSAIVNNKKIGKLMEAAAIGYELFEAEALKAYKFVYPSYSVVDSLGMKLTAWMKGQEKLAKYEYPVIYTNAGSGNIIFKYPTTLKMNRYYLQVANWNTGGRPPICPDIWRIPKIPYYGWQDMVMSAAAYGMTGQIDHDVWGPLMPFPGDQPPPTTDEYAFTAHIVSPIDKTITGVLK